MDDKLWKFGEESPEEQPKQGYFSQAFDNIGAWGSAAYANTRESGMGSDIKDLYDRLKNNDYATEEEGDRLEEEFYRLQDERNQYRNMFEQNQKLLNQNDSMLKDFTEVGGTMQGIGTQLADTAIGAGIGALGGSVLPGVGTVAGLSTGATWGNRIGAVHQAVNDADINAIDAWEKVLREGGTDDQAEQAYKDAFWNNMPTEAMDIASSLYFGNKLTGQAGKILGRVLGNKTAGALTNAASKVSRFDLPARAGTYVAAKTGSSLAGQAVGVGLGMAGNAIEEGIQEPWQDYATERAIDVQRRQYDPSHEGIRDFSVTGEGGLLDYYTTEEGLNTAIKAAKMGAVFGGVGGLLSKSQYTENGTANSDSIQAGRTLNKEFSEEGDFKDIIKTQEFKDNYDQIKTQMGDIYGLTEDETQALEQEDVFRMWTDYYANKYGVGGNRQEATALAQADLVNALTGEETNRRDILNNLSKQYVDKYALDPGGLFRTMGETREEQVAEAIEEVEETAGEDTGIVAKGKEGTFNNETKKNAEQNGQVQQPKVKGAIPENIGKNWKWVDEGQDFDYNVERKFQNSQTGRIAHVTRVNGGYTIQDITDKNEQTQPVIRRTLREVQKFLNSPRANRQTSFQSSGEQVQEQSTQDSVTQELPKEDGVISQKGLSKDNEGNEYYNGKLLQSKDAVSVHTLQDLHNYYQTHKDLMGADLYAEVSRQMMRFGIGKSNNTSIVLDLTNESELGLGSKTTSLDENGAIANAVVRLYAGADLATAAHELAHLGWINLSQQDRDTFTKWALRTERQFVAQVLGMNNDENFQSYLREALTNRGQGGSQTSQELWRRIREQGATAQTIDLLNNQTSYENRLAAVDERFAWEFSNWYAQGFAKGNEPRNIIERILQKACQSLQGALRLLSDTDRYLNDSQGNNGADVADIFTRMSATQKNVGQVQQPQVELRTEMTQPIQEMPYNPNQGFNETYGEDLFSNPTQNIGQNNVGTVATNPRRSAPQKEARKKQTVRYTPPVPNEVRADQIFQQLNQTQPVEQVQQTPVNNQQLQPSGEDLYNQQLIEQAKRDAKEEVNRIEQIRKQQEIEQREKQKEEQDRIKQETAQRKAKEKENKQKKNSLKKDAESKIKSTNAAMNKKNPNLDEIEKQVSDIEKAIQNFAHEEFIQRMSNNPNEQISSEDQGTINRLTDMLKKLQNKYNDLKQQQVDKSAEKFDLTEKTENGTVDSGAEEQTEVTDNGEAENTRGTEDLRGNVEEVQGRGDVRTVDDSRTGEGRIGQDAVEGRSEGNGKNISLLKDKEIYTTYNKRKEKKTELKDWRNMSGDDKLKQVYVDALNTSKEADSEHGVYVDGQTVESLKDCKVVLHKNKMAGFAITKDGNIVGVFSNPKNPIRGILNDMIFIAHMMGGNRMDCFGKFLLRGYRGCGFTPVARTTFAEEYYPADNPSNTTIRKEKPDVFFLVKDNDSNLTYLNNINNEVYKNDQIPVESIPLIDSEDSYSDALDFQSKVLKEIRKKNNANKSTKEVAESLRPVEEPVVAENETTENEENNKEQVQQKEITKTQNSESENITKTQNVETQTETQENKDDDNYKKQVTDTKFMFSGISSVEEKKRERAFRQAAKAAGFSEKFIEEFFNSANKRQAQIIWNEELREGDNFLKFIDNYNQQHSQDGISRGLDGRWFYEFSDKPSSLSDYVLDKNLENEAISVGKTKAVKLSDIFKHDELYQRYPKLANYNVIFSNNKEMGDEFASGDFDVQSKTIRINSEFFKNFFSSDKDKKKMMRLTFLHEIQHAIQDIEGFAFGVNEKQSRFLFIDQTIEKIKQNLNNNIGKELIKALREYDKQIANTDNLTNEELSFIQNSPTTILRNYVTGRIQPNNATTELEKTIVKACIKIGKFNKLKDQSYYNNIQKPLKYLYDSYVTQLGEINARRTSQRADMDLEERRKSIKLLDENTLNTGEEHDNAPIFIQRGTPNLRAREVNENGKMVVSPNEYNVSTQGRGLGSEHRRDKGTRENSDRGKVQGDLRERSLSKESHGIHTQKNDGTSSIQESSRRNRTDTKFQEAGVNAQNQTLLTPDKEKTLEDLFWKLIRKKQFHGMDSRWAAGSLDYYKMVSHSKKGRTDFTPEYIRNDKAYLTAIKNINNYIHEKYPQYKNLYRGVDGHWRFEFSDKDATFINGFEKLEGKELETTLNKILKHDNLYKLYPNLKDVPVHLVKNQKMQEYMDATDVAKKEYYAAYDSNTKSIYINSDMFKDDDARNSLLHEIQHAVQDIEGFANGSSDTDYNNDYDYSEGEKQARLTEKRSNMSEEELAENPRYQTLNTDEKIIIEDQRPRKVGKTDTKFQSNGQNNLGYIDKQKDIYSVTFTKSAQKNAENQRRIAFYRNNKSYWNETTDKSGSIVFTRALPYKQHQKTIIYDDINGKKVGKRKKTKVREYIEAMKDQIVKYLFNDKHFLKKAARNVGALESYMRMMVMKDQGAVAGAAIEDGIVKHNGKNGERTKSLNSIIETIGEENQLEFLDYCEAFRVLDLEKRGIEQKMKPDYARKLIARIQRSKNAKLFEEQRKNFVEYNHELLWVLVDGGFITEQQYDKFIKNDPNFIPLAKNMDELEGYVDGFRDSKTMINVAHPMHKIGTSLREVKNPFLEMQKRTVEYYVKASRNKAGHIFVHDIAEAIAQDANGNVVAANQGMVRKLASRDKDGRPISHDNKQYVFYVWENGEKQYYQVADREIYIALKSFDAEQMGALSKIMNQTAGRASRLVRNTATMTPDFGLRNLIRDNVEAFVSSEHGFLPLIDSLWGMYQMANDTQWFREYQSLNGERLSLNREGEDIATVEHDIKDNVKFYKNIIPLFKKDWREFTDKSRSKTARAWALVKLITLDMPFFPLQALYKGNRRLNDYLETGTRIGEYRNARMGYNGLYGRLFEGKGNTIFTNDADLKRASTGSVTAAYKAKDITLNFGQHGVLGKELNRYIPFFNASLQGIYKLGNTIDTMIRGDNTRIKQELWFKCVLMGAIGMAAALAGSGDDDYDEAPDYEHDNFWILPNGIRIPKDQLFGRLVGGTVEKATAQYLKTGDIKKMELIKDILGNFTIDKCVPAIVDLAWGTVGNYDSFRGRSVTPEYMADKLGYLQKDLSTSKIGVDISEILYKTLGINIGAKKVDFVISKTLSNFGNYVKNLYELGTNPNERMTRGAEPEDKGGFAEMSKELPYPMNTIVGTFATSRNTFQSISDFYDRHKELKTLSSDESVMSKAEKKAWDAYQKAYKEDKKFRDALKAIKQDKSLTGAQKRQKADKIFKQQIRVAKKLKDWERRHGLV